ncbi:MAG: COX15/CtaA family protein [Planctomycetota bacterium]|nr:COX15/CtaA family protein [Planctomycetota bacterium]
MDDAPALTGSASASPSDATPTPYRAWLHRFAVALVVTTFGLVALGGTVTSKGAGLAVPDWPTTFQHSMFTYPLSKLHGGEWWEHTHRMLGSIVGLQVLILAGWVWLTQTSRTGLRWVAMAMVPLVIVQGLMGGLRVTETNVGLAFLHGILGQLFLCAGVAVAAATSRWWIDQLNARAGNSLPRSPLPAGATLSLVLLAVLVVQLVLGAAVRHTGSGLAIPDFPSSYGKLLPPMNKAALREMYQAMPEEQFTQEYFVYQVHLQFGHRLWAVVVLGMIVATATRVARHTELAKLRRPAAALVALTLVQIALGALVIWSGRHPEIATAHQATGAALLATAALLAMRLRRANIHASMSDRPVNSQDLKAVPSAGPDAPLQGAQA